MSPFLFAMYINDLEEHLATRGNTGIDLGHFKLFLLLYADDAIIMSETAVGLQNGLNVLSEYCTRWKLQLNTDKTKIVVFRAGGRLRANESWKYNEFNLEVVSYFVYLGLAFSYTGSFAKAQQTLAAQARKAIFSLHKYTRKFVNLNPYIMCELFDKMIAPILCYACEVWGFHPADAVERVHREFCKTVLRMKSSTLNEFVYGELGRTPMYVLRHARIIKYWLKLLESNDRNLTKQMYNLQYEYIQNHENKVNWVSLVRNLLYEHGFGYVWQAQSVGDTGGFLRVFKMRSLDMYRQKWHIHLTNSHKSFSYRLFHESWASCDYLKLIMNAKHRLALTQLRTRNNRLNVECGSWVRPPIPYERRYCQFCPNKLEDEYHFVIECNQYIVIRKRYLPRYYIVNPNMLKFIELMSSNNKRLLIRLAAFVHHAFVIRNASLYN